jgi:hypothetical protein
MNLSAAVRSALPMVFSSLAVAADASAPGSPDYGQFVTATVEASFPAARNTAMKGLVIKLAEGGTADLCFDTDLLRVSAVWDGGYLVLPKGRDGIEGHPKPAGAVRIGTKPGPGWAKGGSFADPRDNHQGPLPRDWAKYEGLFLNGPQVVLSYRVGKTEVLESPAYDAAAQLFTRAFTLGASGEALTLLVCEDDGATGTVAGGTATLVRNGATTVVGAAGLPAGAAFAIADGGRVQLTLPAGAARSFTLAMWGGAAADAAKAGTAIAALGKPADLHAACAGGPPRWGQPLATAIEPGTGAGPYVVDHVKVPLDNPWRSYMRLTGFDFYPDGRAAVSTMDGDVWIVDHLDTQAPTWKRFATGLFQALGVKILDGRLLVLGRDQITELQDLNHDGEADSYRCFNNDCIVTDNYHEFALDLQADHEGNLYYCKGSPWPPEVKSAHQGCLMKVAKDGSKTEVFATGLRAPNGSGMGPHDELTFSDNQGHWTPACKVNVVKQGGFYGMTPAAHRASPPTEYDKPLFWIPMDVDNSSGGQGWTTSGKWGPFKDQMVFTSYGKSTFFIVLQEQVGGQQQGGVVQLPLAFTSGLMRVRESPADGQLYALGMRGWQTNAGQAGCFDRIRYTGKPVYLPLTLHVAKDRLTIPFTGPLKAESVADLDNWSIDEWNYQWTGKYGSDDFKPSDGKKGRDHVAIAAAKLGSDGKTITLEIPGLAPVMQMKIKMKLQAADGTPVETTIYNTINVVP